jgi:uridine kinase
MFVYDNVFQNDDDIRKFVSDAEEHYKKQVIDIANDVAKYDNIRFLTLAGPTCSGKTTSSYILEQEFEKRGISTKIISIDDFYRSRYDIADDEEPDFESVTAIDLPLFKKCVNRILNGKTAEIPKYDFMLGVRTKYTPHTPAENEIIIFEGIQAIYPEIIETLPKQATKSIYISVDEDVMAYGTHFDKREVRFLRRLVRDYLFRNATPGRTLELWHGVVKNEDINIIPYEGNADYIINSFLPYELGVIKPYVLHKISYDDKNEDECVLFESLKKEFQNIVEIPSHFVPIDSVFREFIGKEK